MYKIIVCNLMLIFVYNLMITVCRLIFVENYLVINKRNN